MKQKNNREKDCAVNPILIVEDLLGNEQLTWADLGYKRQKPRKFDKVLGDKLVKIFGNVVVEVLISIDKDYRWAKATGEKEVIE